MTAIWSEQSGDPGHPLVVVIHGSMDRSAGLLKVSRCLDDRYRVLRYDRRGYGRSRPHPGPFTMADQLDDLVGLVGDRRAVLIGHSYGGNVALAATARDPSRFVGAAVYETPLSWEAWWPGTTAGALAIQNTEPEVAAEAFLRRMLGDERWERLPQRTRDARCAEGAAMVGELRDLRFHRPWRASDVHVPVVAAFGSLGQPHHRVGMEHVAGSIDGCRLVELVGCRHDAPLSHADLFCDQVVRPVLDAVGGEYGSVRAEGP